MTLGIIAGTGTLDLFEPGETRCVETSWGAPSADLVRVRVGQGEAWFLARHGQPHRIAPHRINYRANIDAFRQLGVRRVLAINAVGAVSDQAISATLAIPDQLIDYTWGRAHSYCDDNEGALQHVEFAEPFSGQLREQLIRAARAAELDCLTTACVAVTQGPRLETAAEVQRMRRDGADLVGMTSMPEAALAREAGLDYASVCVISNPAAGLAEEAISTAAIHAVLAASMNSVRRLLNALMER